MKTNEKVAAALKEFKLDVAIIGGCSDGACIINGPAKGMHTNGGCKCHYEHQLKFRAFSAATYKLIKALEK